MRAAVDTTHHRGMEFEAIMAKLQAWTVAGEALAALGARLELQQRAADAPPAVAAALEDAISAAGIDGLEELPPPQRAMLLAIIRMTARHMSDLLDEPDRPAGWTYTDPDILDGWGRGSAMLPAQIAASNPALADLGNVLDVGTGVGLLACAAAAAWPRCRVVGIDPWAPSLERARANIERAGLTDRVELRAQRLSDLAEESVYDCAWVPTFFLSDAELAASFPALVRAVKPGGWIVLGRMRSAPDPLPRALVQLRIARAGGADVTRERADELFGAAHCRVVEPLPSSGPSPVELMLGQRPD